MKNRKLHIELIRIFAICMTIMVHVSNLYIVKFPNIKNVDFLISVIYNALARVCVPLFFMISGIFLIRGEYDSKKYWRRIWKFVLILAVWSLIYYLRKHGFVLQNIGKDFIITLFEPKMTSSHLWYMYALIGLYIALPFIQNMCRNMSREQENLFIGLWAGLSGLDAVYMPLVKLITGQSVSVKYPIPIVYATYYLGYFVCGYILYNRLKEVKGTAKRNRLCVATYLLTSIVSALITYFVSIKQNVRFEAMVWYRGILVIVATFSIFIFVVMNEEKIKGEGIAKVAGLTFGVYLSHYLFIIDMKKWIDVSGYTPAIFIPVVTVVIYIASLGLSWVVKRIPILKELM